MQNCQVYADDTNIHCSNKDVCAVQNNLNIDLENATSWFIHNGMKPNPDKYQAMVLGKKEDELNFKLADIDIKTTDETCLLGVVVDNKLKFDDHISTICRKVSAQISALNRLKNILSPKTKESLYRAFILPYFNYVNHSIQEMLLTINNCISDKAPSAMRDLITLRSSKYNLRHDYILSLPKLARLNMVSIHGDVLSQRNGTS